MATKEDKKAYADIVSEKIINALKEGTAPWVKPWSGAELEAMAPRNAKTNKPYNGMNHVNLAVSGYEDPRWLTFNQAQEMGVRINKGEKSTMIHHWKFTEKVDKVDDKGNKVIGEDGKPEQVEVRLKNPKVYFAKVFNAEQTTGLPPLPPVEKSEKKEFEAIEKAEKLLENSGANISHVVGNRAYYAPSQDKITLPQKEQFNSEMEYYSTALHELGHWTGHSTRLDRDMSGSFGDASYAKEELRAEIASFMLCSELGVDFDPANHFAYIDSWVKALEDDNKEIFRASSDAQKISNFIQDLSQEKTKTEEQKEEVKMEDPSKIIEIVNEVLEEHPIRLSDGLLRSKSDDGTSFVFESNENSSAMGAKSEWISKEELVAKFTASIQELGVDKVLGISSSIYKEELEAMTTSKPSQAQANVAQKEPTPSPTPQKDEAKLEQKTYLVVPFQEKEEAKKAGAKWDAQQKSWYAPEGTNLAPLKKFMENTQAPKPTQEQIQQAKDQESTKQPQKEAPVKNVPKQENQEGKFETKVYLYVDYKEKEEAKKAGAKWDKEVKLWYAPEGSQKDNFEKFLPENNTAKISSAIGEDAMTSFKTILEAKGFIIKGYPQADGKMHRVPVDRDKGAQNSGMYVIHMDGKPTMHYQNHKTGEKDNVSFNSAEFSKGADKQEIAKQYAINQAQRLNGDIKQEKLYQDTSIKVAKEFKDLLPAPKNHNYLVSKGIAVHNAKVDQHNNLVVPYFNAQGQHMTSQKISSKLKDADGNKIPKRFEKGGQKSGNFAIIGAESTVELYSKIAANNKICIVCEGFATGASLHEATGMPVIVAGDSGNMAVVAENIAKELDKNLDTVILACDHDQAGIKGGEKAQEALEKKEINSIIITPKLGTKDLESGLSDFNDLAQSKGLEQVKVQVVTNIATVSKQEQVQTQAKSKENNSSLEMTR